MRSSSDGPLHRLLSTIHHRGRRHRRRWCTECATAATNSPPADDTATAALGMLVAAGADLEAVDYRRQTPLQAAAYAGDAAAVRLLVGHGADARRQLDYGRTALHGAARAGATEAVAALLEAGASADSADVNGERPLHWCMQQATARGWAAAGYEASVLQLLAAGADPEAASKHGMAAIDIGYLEMTGAMDQLPPSIVEHLAKGSACS